MKRTGPELILAGVVSVAILAYGALLAFLGIDGSVGMAVVGGASSVATGVGAYSLAKRKFTKEK